MLPLASRLSWRRRHGLLSHYRSRKNNIARVGDVTWSPGVFELGPKRYGTISHPRCLQCDRKPHGDVADCIRLQEQICESMRGNTPTAVMCQSLEFDSSVGLRYNVCFLGKSAQARKRELPPCNIMSNLNVCLIRRTRFHIDL